MAIMSSRLWEGRAGGACFGGWLAKFISICSWILAFTATDSFVFCAESYLDYGMADYF